MKTIPMLFSTAMVQAILKGRKTQTRRIVKHQPKIDPQTGDWLYSGLGDQENVYPIEEWVESHLKYNDYICKTIWVRETFMPISQDVGPDRYEYRATETINTKDKWRPSLFMPKGACRIWLKVTDVRVERLNDISEEDAIAEGCYFDKDSGYYYAGDVAMASRPVSCYRELWEHINGKGSWERNPFVYAISFERCDKPERFR